MGRMRDIMWGQKVKIMFFAKHEQKIAQRITTEIISIDINVQSSTI